MWSRALGLAAWGAPVLLATASGCGRIGYDPLPEEPPREGGASRPHDASAIVESVEPGADATLVEAGADAMADAGADSACAMSATVNYCESIPPLPAPPVIDGLLDCGPSLVPITPEDWRGAAPLPPFPSGNTAEVAAAWRPDGLYIFMAVTTPAAIPADPGSSDYYGAGVELFVDSTGVFPDAPMYNAPGTSQLIVTAPPDEPPDAAEEDCGTDASAPDTDAQAASTGQRGEIYRNEGEVGPWTSSQFGTFTTPSGFVFEGFIVAADLGLSGWTLAAGGTIGFDVAVDVSFPTVCQTGLEGHRAGQYFLQVTTGLPEAGADASDDAAPPTPIGPPYMDTRSFCTPTLTSM